MVHRTLLLSPYTNQFELNIWMLIHGPNYDESKYTEYNVFHKVFKSNILLTEGSK